MSWSTEPMTGFALATTDAEPSRARLVAFATRTVNDGKNDPAEVWTVKTPVKIPGASVHIHGIMNDFTDEYGFEPADVLVFIHDQITEAVAKARPLVVFNASWVFAVLANEARHAGVDFTLPEGLVLIDPLVIDEHFAPARRAGNRTLRALLNEWQIRYDGLGKPEQNVNGALRLAWKLGEKHPALRNMTPPELHRAQAQWKAEREAERQVYLDSRGRIFPEMVGAA